MNVLKNYFAHMALYVGAAYSIYSAIDPKVIPPSLLPYLLGVGAILGGLHQLILAPTHPENLPAPTPGAVAKLHILTVIFTLLLVLAVLPGCATLTSAKAQPYITITADVAVGIAESKGVTAAQINTVASAALAADSGVSASLSAIDTVIATQLAKLKLNAAEQSAATILVSSLTAAVQAQVGANASVAQAQAAIADVLQAIIAATAIAGA